MDLILVSYYYSPTNTSDTFSVCEQKCVSGISSKGLYPAFGELLKWRLTHCVTLSHYFAPQMVSVTSLFRIFSFALEYYCGIQNKNSLVRCFIKISILIHRLITSSSCSTPTFQCYVQALTPLNSPGNWFNLWALSLRGTVQHCCFRKLLLIYKNAT